MLDMALPHPFHPDERALLHLFIEDIIACFPVSVKKKTSFALGARFVKEFFIP
jgi:hypothetical protein